MLLQLTNDTSWIRISEQSMQDTCQTAITRNATVRQHIIEAATANVSSVDGGSGDVIGVTEQPTPQLEDIYNLEEIVKEIRNLCPNNCSGKGECITGNCSIF